VQLKLVFLLGGIALASSIVICMTAYERIMRLKAMYLGQLTGPVFLPADFYHVADSLMYRLLAVVSIMIIVFTFLGVFLTHRLVGPIWKLQRDLKNLFDGKEIGPIGFRKNDEFKDLPILINKLIESYKKNK
jgi:methyl-accepting chemotaxis protein